MKSLSTTLCLSLFFILGLHGGQALSQEKYLSMKQIQSVEAAANSIIIGGLEGAIEQIRAAEAGGKRSFTMRYQCPKMGDALARIATNSSLLSSSGAEKLGISEAKLTLFAAVTADTAEAKIAVVQNGGIVDETTMPTLERTIKLSDGVKHAQLLATAKECLMNYLTRAKLFE